MSTVAPVARSLALAACRPGGSPVWEAGPTPALWALGLHWLRESTSKKCGLSFSLSEALWSQSNWRHLKTPFPFPRPQSAVGFEYQGKTEKHASQKGRMGRQAAGQPWVGQAVSSCGGEGGWEGGSAGMLGRRGPRHMPVLCGPHEALRPSAGPHDACLSLGSAA